jgi:RNA polymerase sigma factor (sigma-70 family)
MEEPDFASLMSRVRAGDSSAIDCLLRTYEAEVRLMVRARLPQALRRQFDSMDFVQSVWASVLLGSTSGREDFTTPRRFLGYLAAVAQNKVWEEFRKRTRSKKYQMAREEPLYVRRGVGHAPREVTAPDPSPSEEAQAADRMKQLAAGRSPAEALALDLRRQGLTFEEIAARTGLNERTARRLIESLRSRMEARRWE